MVNYYHILGLSTTTSQAEIKAAYRKLALRYHPDKNGGSSYAEERFKQISEAYRVLSDPRKKARHDWALEYEVYQQTQTPATWNTAPMTNTAGAPPYRPRHRAGQRVRPRFDSRQNIVATAWAFGIFFLIALFVVGITAWSDYQQEQTETEQLQEAQEIFQKAEMLYQEGSFGPSLNQLKKVPYHQKLVVQKTKLKATILQSLQDEGLRLYDQGDYVAAARMLQLLADQLPDYRPNVLAHLIASYEVMQDYEGAVRGYKSVIKAEPRTIEARNRLAMIYAEHYKDFDTALEYYRQASDLVTEQYKTEYGNAYALTVNPTRTPDSHYQLHCGMAQVYISQGMLQQAESALKWAIFLRPEEPIAYYLMGIRHREAKDATAACRAWQQAADRGSPEAASFVAANCR